MSKYTRLHYKGHILHIVDTPGHADFGGEVERVLSMVDGVILLVDASEGPMSQTKFVLSKALAAKKKAVVVMNKVDREGHRAVEVENEILDLFCALTSSEDELDYPVLYASAKQGWVATALSYAERKDVSPLLDKILDIIPPPIKQEKLNEHFAMSVNTIQSDNHLGRLVTGKIETGVISIGDKVKIISRDGEEPSGGSESKVTKLFYFEGLNRVDVDKAYAGQIISLAGCHARVADTVCNPAVTTPVFAIAPSPPVISMTFGPNDSPLAGKEGSKLTSSMIKERLAREIENNVTLSLEGSPDPEAIDVKGRGELQIGILVETLRREGYELTVSPPKILSVKDQEGNVKEPFEEVSLDIDMEYQGQMMEMINKRSGEISDIKDIGDRMRILFKAPSRGMMGFRYEAMNATRGNATVNSTFSHYEVVKMSDFAGLKKGKLVSCETGKSNGYALTAIEERGFLFIGVGEDIYEGMVIGESAKGDNLDVNPCKSKKLSNVRSTGAEEKVSLTPPKRMTIEEVIAYMDEDEVLEVTPKSLRLRKRILDTAERQRYNKRVGRTKG